MWIVSETENGLRSQGERSCPQPLALYLQRRHPNQVSLSVYCGCKIMCVCHLCCSEECTNHSPDCCCSRLDISMDYRHTSLRIAPRADHYRVSLCPPCHAWSEWNHHEDIGLHLTTKSCGFARLVLAKLCAVSCRNTEYLAA